MRGKDKRGYRNRIEYTIHADSLCRACRGDRYGDQIAGREPNSMRNLRERNMPFYALQQGLVFFKVQITAPQRAQIGPTGMYIAILRSLRFYGGSLDSNRKRAATPLQQQRPPL